MQIATFPYSSLQATRRAVARPSGRYCGPWPFPGDPPLPPQVPHTPVRRVFLVAWGAAKPGEHAQNIGGDDLPGAGDPPASGYAPGAPRTRQDNGYTGGFITRATTSGHTRTRCRAGQDRFGLPAGSRPPRVAVLQERWNGGPARPPPAGEHAHWPTPHPSVPPGPVLAIYSHPHRISALLQPACQRITPDGINSQHRSPPDGSIFNRVPASGAASSGRRMPPNCAVGGHGRARSGTATRSSFR